MRLVAPIALLTVLACSPMAHSGERQDHFEGEPAPSLQQAFKNLSEYNARLASRLDNDELTASDHNEIHELTYTLEHALHRIREEVDAMAAKLEQIHVASEARDSETVRQQAPAYLSATGRLAVE